MPSPLQKRVLLALESGCKLHEALQETGMPAKSLVEEWRNQPEFDALFEVAAGIGKALRESRTGKPEAETKPAPTPRRPVPAPAPKRVKREKNPEARKLRGPATVHGTPDDARRLELSGYLTNIIGDEATYTPPRGRDSPLPEPIALPITSHSPTMSRICTTPAVKLQQQALEKMRSGMKWRELLALPGINANSVSKWRRDPSYKDQWEAAKLEGKGKKPAPASPPQSSHVPNLPANLPAKLPAPIMQLDLQPAEPTTNVDVWPAPAIMPRNRWLEFVEANRRDDLRNALVHQLLDTEQGLNLELVNEYNELAERMARALAA